MKGRVSKSAIVDVCLEGVISSQKQYEAMSGGDWVCWAPEYFITSCLAQSLNQMPGSKYVTIENGAYDALDYAGAVGKGRLHGDIRSNGRFDLLLWWAKGDPRAVIEVKNRVLNKTQYEADLKRITAVLKRKKLESTMEFGAFAFYSATDDSSTKNSSEILIQRQATIQKNAQDIVGDEFCATLHSSDIKIEGESGWFAGCLLIEHT
ncbi:hypothetical protein [Vibrio penaeicida]|uniref:Uncharacterized protein n=1 Tax=Vibrio penaeicida TaxID=104609 RepID=A0AAV5NUE5_9VIBR|nr:hypothetical protein [Vibrio penaeicida]RTZ22972.1 hypothetical protein EKN09_11385 [Vibrio penaeicida]GLQ74060.1 hypothetical protein GCM10007932_34210 [Vibrio penaeicida]